MQLPNEGIIAVIRSGKKISERIDKWIEAFEDNADTATAEMLQLIVYACGNKGRITEQTVRSLRLTATSEEEEQGETDRASAIVEKLATQFDESSGDYPLTLPGVQTRKFRAALGDFFLLFVSKCRDSIILDQRLMNPMLKLLTKLTASLYRAFRHTATFIAMKIASAMVDLAVETEQLIQANTAHIQEKIQQQAADDSDAAMRDDDDPNATAGTMTMAQLEAEGERLEDKQQSTRQMVQLLFKRVFVERYRDIAPDIRMICVSELGDWMVTYPAMFLEDNYLKYLGWCLNDRAQEVRLKCIEILHPMYERPELWSKLELFTNKYKNRLTNMAMDIKDDVAINTCRLLCALNRAFPSMLEPDDYHAVLDIVYSGDQAWASAAGEFLVARLSGSAARAAAVSNPSNPNAMDTSGDVPQRPDLLLAAIADFNRARKAQDESLQDVEYLVDSLISSTPALKDWKTMVAMLESDEYSSDINASLVDIMCCAINQACTGARPAGRADLKKIITVDDRKVMKRERRHVSEALMPSLPGLLSKFIYEEDILNRLMEIPSHFRPELYSEEDDMEEHLDALLEIFNQVLEHNRTDDNIIEKAVKVYQHFGTNSAIAEKIETTGKRVIARAAEQIQGIVAKFGTGEEDLYKKVDKDDETTVITNSRVLKIFVGAFDMHTSNSSAWDPVLEVVMKSEKFRSQEPSEKGIYILFQILAWHLKHALIDKENDASSIQQLLKRRDQFIHVVEITMRGGGVDEAFINLVDLMMIINWKLLDTDIDPRLAKTLPVSLSRQQIEHIAIVLTDRIFVIDESATTRSLNKAAKEKLAEKRRYLLTQFCKLVIYEVLPMIDIAPVLRHYTKEFNEYADITRYLLKECRLLDRVSLAKPMIIALKDAYELAKVEGGEAPRPGTKALEGVRELARKLTVSFGPDVVVNREVITMIHRDGISYALEKTRAPGKDDAMDDMASERSSALYGNLSFLEPLAELSVKLVHVDKVKTSELLKNQCPVKPEPTDESDKRWRSYVLYKNSLEVTKARRSEKPKPKPAEKVIEEDEEPMQIDEDED